MPVIELASEAAVDAAWNAYAEFAVRIADNQALLWDREFNRELARRHERWKALFIMSER